MSVFFLGSVHYMINKDKYEICPCGPNDSILYLLIWLSDIICMEVITVNAIRMKSPDSWGGPVSVSQHR